jgi:hypothetical protein
MIGGAAPPAGTVWSGVELSDDEPPDDEPLVDEPLVELAPDDDPVLVVCAIAGTASASKAQPTSGDQIICERIALTVMGTTGQPGNGSIVG